MKFKLVLFERLVGVVFLYVDLGNREIASSKVCSLVSFELGWPQEGQGTGESAVIKNNPNPGNLEISLDYNFVQKIKIERGKAFQRFLYNSIYFREKKKLSISIHHASSWLFMSSRTCIGKASLKLDSLLTLSEIHEVLDV